MLYQNCWSLSSFLGTREHYQNEFYISHFYSPLYTRDRVVSWFLTVFCSVEQANTCVPLSVQSYCYMCYQGAFVLCSVHRAPQATLPFPLASSVYQFDLFRMLRSGESLAASLPLFVGRLYADISELIVILITLIFMRRNASYRIRIALLRLICALLLVLTIFVIC